MSKANLIQECQREFENCLYTSTSLLLWLRWRRMVKTGFIVLPIILGAVATWELVTQSQIMWVRILASVCAFLSGLMPSIYAALKYDDDLEKLSEISAEFMNLRDRFRQLAILSSNKSFKDFEADFKSVMDRMEEARRNNVTAPEWCFKRAQKKIVSGDYSYDVDADEADQDTPKAPEGPN